MKNSFESGDIGSMFSVLMLNTDNSYLEQKKLLKRGKIFDLTEIPEKKYMASPDTIKKIERLLPEKGRFISFLGSGDYHYITYLFLKKIKRKTTLVVFDNHIDCKPVFDETFLSCGSWIKNALELPFIEKVIVLTNEKNEFTHPYLKILKPEPEQLKEELKKTSNIYLSIDKDILSKETLNTNWDQGNLSIDLLEKLIDTIPVEKLSGVDVCGEPEPLNIFEIKKSENINLKIIAKIAEREAFAPAG